LVVGPYTLHPAGARPTITAVTLADGNEVAGLNINSASTGIDGDGSASGTITSVGISGGTDGILLTNASGTFTLTNVTVAPGGAGVTISGTADVTANNVAVTTSGFTGILGTGTGTVTFNGGSVSTTTGTAIDLSNHTLVGSGLVSVSASNGVDGIRLTGTSGSFTVTGTGAAGSGGTITGMTDRGVDLVNAGTVSLSYMNINASAQQGVLMQSTTAAASSVSVASSSFSGNFSNAVQAANSSTGTMTVSVNASTFANNNAAVIVQSTSGPMDVTITNNTATFNTGGPFSVVRNATATGGADVIITGNTIGTSGVPGSGATCGNCIGIQVVALGSNVMNAQISNNTIRQITGSGIIARAGEGTGSLNATITNNLIEQPFGTPTVPGMQVQSGSLSADTNAVCAGITGNTVTGYTTHIFVRNVAAGTTFSLPGYAGLGTDTTAVANFLKANNNITTATALRKTTAPANQFSGGPACPTPTP
ncbi:MAG: hypothetical protein ACLGH0_04855, partial [Thermoanaerobaculia bacterium]